MARIRNTRVQRGAVSPGDRGNAGVVSSLDSELPGDRRRGDGPPGRRFPAHRPGRLPPAHRRTDSRRHRHAHGFRPRPPSVRSGGRARRDRSDPRMAPTRGNLPFARSASRRWVHQRLEAAADGIPPPRRCPRAAPAALRPVHALTDEGIRGPGAQSVGTSASGRQGHEGDCARSPHFQTSTSQAC